MKTYFCFQPTFLDCSLSWHVYAVLCCAATSSCDPATDQAIQQALQAESREHGTTVLTIAHRLHTILDCHKILVMRRGEVAEFAAPGALLADPHSEFSRMLSDYNSAHR